MHLIKQKLIFILNRLLSRRYIIWKNVNADDSEICLTFDDGPSRYTERILNVLDSNNVKAIFFLVGKNIKKEFSLAESILMRGHMIGMHGYHHKDMTSMTIREFVNDLNMSELIFRDLCGEMVKIYRPPYGRISLLKLMILWLKGYKVVMWSKDIKDYKSDSDEIQLKKMNNVSVDGGDIFLFHDTSRITSRTLDDFIKMLQKRSISIACTGFVE